MTRSISPLGKKLRCGEQRGEVRFETFAGLAYSRRRKNETEMVGNGSAGRPRAYLGLGCGASQRADGYRRDRAVYPVDGRHFASGWVVIRSLLQQLGSAGRHPGVSDAPEG